MDLYNRFNQHYNFLIDEYHRDKSSMNVQNKFITDLTNTVNTTINKLCLDLDLHKNFKYFYLYVLNLFIQNLVNAMINTFKRVMTNNIIEYVTDTVSQKNPNKVINIDDDIAKEISRFEKQINDDMFRQMYGSLTNKTTKDCYNYIAVICFITYLETNSFEFVNTLTDKIVTGETSINLNFNNASNSFIPNYTESNNSFCIDCIDCMSCLCCYNCYNCVICNCCINCRDNNQSMYCMNSLNVRNSFYVNNSINIFYCHKCCTCNICYYSDHITNCFNVMYVSNVTNLYNNQKSFIQPMSKRLYENKDKFIKCFQRRIPASERISRDSVAESIDENIVLNHDIQPNQSIPRSDIYYQYTQIIKICNKQISKNNYNSGYTNVNDDYSLIYGCSYPMPNDVYFDDNGFRNNKKWNATQLSFCGLDYNKKLEQCQTFMNSEFNPFSKNVRKRFPFNDNNRYYKHVRY